MRCNHIEEKFEVWTQLRQAHRHATCTGKHTHTKTQARNLRRQAHSHRHTSHLSACSFTQSSPLTPTHTHAYTLIPNTWLTSQTWWWWCWFGIHTTCIPQAQCPFEFNSTILSITCTLSMLCYAATKHYFGTFCGNFSSRSTRTENALATRCTHRLHNNTKKKNKNKTNKTDF